MILIKLMSKNKLQELNRKLLKNHSCEYANHFVRKRGYILDYYLNNKIDVRIKLKNI